MSKTEVIFLNLQYDCHIVASIFIKLNNHRTNGVEAFLYCQLEGAVGDETITLARQQSTDIFFFSEVNVVPHKTMRIMLQCSVPSFVQ